MGGVVYGSRKESALRSSHVKVGREFRKRASFMPVQTSSVQM